MELHSIIFLIAILSLIFLLTFIIHSKQKRKTYLASDKQEPRFDMVNQSAFANKTESHEDNFVYADELLEEDDDEADSLWGDPLLEPAATTKPKTKEQKSADSQGELLFIMLAARPDKPYAGYELLQSLLSAGLRFGASDLFHRYEDINTKDRILFSVASASETGTFEINKMGAYSVKGLMLFMRLSTQRDLMSAFETMIETGRQLIEDLGGDMLDEDRKPITNDKIERMRKVIVEFERKQLTGDLFDEETVPR